MYKLPSVLGKIKLQSNLVCKTHVKRHYDLLFLSKKRTTSNLPTEMNKAA